MLVGCVQRKEYHSQSISSSSQSTSRFWSCSRYDTSFSGSPALSLVIWSWGTRMKRLVWGSRVNRCFLMTFLHWFFKPRSSQSGGKYSAWVLLGNNCVCPLRNTGFCPAANNNTGSSPVCWMEMHLNSYFIPPLMLTMAPAAKSCLTMASTLVGLSMPYLVVHGPFRAVYPNMLAWFTSAPRCRSSFTMWGFVLSAASINGEFPMRSAMRTKHVFKSWTEMWKKLSFIITAFHSYCSNSTGLSLNLECVICESMSK